MQLKIDMLSSIEVIDLNPDSFVTKVTFQYDDDMVTDYLFVEPSQLMLLISELTVKIAQVVKSYDAFEDRDSAQCDGLYSLWNALNQAATIARVLYGFDEIPLTIAAAEAIDTVLPSLTIKREFTDIFTNNPTLATIHCK